MQACQSKTRTGAACRAPASVGGLCFFHANPDRARSLGQIGGRRNRRSITDLQVPDNMTAADLCKVTGEAMRLLLAGQLGSREATALAQLSNSMFRIIPTAELENRVTMLEEQLIQQGPIAHEEDGIGPASDSNGSPVDEIEVAKTDVSEQEAASSSAEIEYDPER